jgi:hypothetical protein
VCRRRRWDLAVEGGSEDLESSTGLGAGDSAGSILVRSECEPEVGESEVLGCETAKGFVVSGRL